MGQPIAEFGKFLEGLRGAMSLREAAKKSGLSHAYIRDLELEKNRSTNERITPSPDTLKKLSAAYDYPYTELMIKAGHLVEQDISTGEAANVDIDLSAVLYIEIGMKEITYFNRNDKLRKSIASLRHFSLFLDMLDEHQFKKVDTAIYVNFRQIRKYDERGGKLYFDTEGRSVSVTMSALRQRKYHDLIQRSVANNNNTSLEFSFDKHGHLQSSFSPTDK
ncbi:helix-turn-helix domain-containing protein [Paenibacillus xerothermodurans]|uniref:Helix-turn-helix domain-containing protein n=1 Tax=Paenibacillus xerothermodurans TaxID=1977292 RepID=A0A2W1NAM9_PAEXE|nr:helix-turn-helix domain-containing protein [Paenibacillus xerothermodurans]PZE21004.1 helix-turn-helix domain-containing protein [Paenibacillus xerothermodurans]